MSGRLSRIPKLTGLFCPRGAVGVLRAAARIDGRWHHTSSCARACTCARVKTRAHTYAHVHFVLPPSAACAAPLIDAGTLPSLRVHAHTLLLSSVTLRHALDSPSDSEQEATEQSAVWTVVACLMVTVQLVFLHCSVLYLSSSKFSMASSASTSRPAASEVS